VCDRISPAWILLALAPPFLGTPVRGGAQSTIDRSPNINDGWTVPAGTLQFNFVHRFEHGPGPSHKVTNFPTFFTEAGVGGGWNVGVVYATNSTVFAGVPNEYELSVRRAIFGGTGTHALGASVTGGYNSAAESADGELSVKADVGRLRFLTAVRGMSNGYDAQRGFVGAGEGVVMHLPKGWSVSGDYFSLFNRNGDPSLSAAWSAALSWKIPYSPHSLSLQVTNGNTGSIEGSSVGTKSGHRFGFEFTIPINLKRYFGS
jgi:hypothetical protein